MTTLIFALPGNEAAADRLASLTGFLRGDLQVRQFPDGETYLRYRQSVGGHTVILVCTLDRPDAKYLAVAFAAASARAQGATRIGLVAPYLAYMRQDREFESGEAVTSPIFARLLSAQVDWLVTVDPHLHRTHALDEIYSIPTETVRAGPMIGAWVRGHVDRPVLIGPDSESTQWVSAVATIVSAPFAVLEKVRHSADDVSISLPDMQQWRDRTPVLVDDIVSAGHTMIEATRQLRKTGIGGPICIAIHAVFAGDALAQLRQAGVRRVVTCNTIPHETNTIDISPAQAEAVRKVSRQ